MSATDYSASPDRNFVTCVPGKPQQEVELVRDGWRALAALEAAVKRLPFDVEWHQLHAARALLARDSRALERAMRLVWCPPASKRLHGRHLGTRRLPCKNRACVYCAERKAQRLSAMLAGRAARYRAPLVILIAAPSTSLLDLPSSLQRFRKAFATLRRRRWFATSLTSGALVLEAPLMLDRRRWNVHAHGVVDAPAGGPELRSRCAEQWAELVCVSDAVLAFEPLRDLKGLFRYGLKVGRSKSTAPDVGTLSPEQMAHLDVALRGRRLTITWGHAPTRHASPVSPASRARAGNHV
jgi:hypothetical protein